MSDNSTLEALNYSSAGDLRLMNKKEPELNFIQQGSYRMICGKLYRILERQVSDQGEPK